MFNLFDAFVSRPPPKAAPGLVSRPIIGNQPHGGLNFGGLLAHNQYVVWLILLGSIFLGLALGKIGATVLRRIAGRMGQRKWSISGRLIADLAGPANLILITGGLWVGLAQVRLDNTDARIFINKFLLLLTSIALFWYVFKLMALAEVLLLRVAPSRSTFDRQLAVIVRKTLRIFVVVIAALFIVQNVFDRDVASWLAGLGIVGLAISLAAQDSLKNVIGSLTILLDRPFQLGQWITYHDYNGTVEEIGFRSTKLRTFDGHLVNIPNSNIVNEPVENVAVRPCIRRVLNLTVTYDTSPDKIDEAVRMVRDILESPEFYDPVHHANNENPPRVYFTDFNADNLNIVVYYYFAPTDYWQYLDYSHRFNLAVMRAFDKARIDFSFPTRTVFLASDPRRPLHPRLTIDANGRTHANGHRAPDGAAQPQDAALFAGAGHAGFGDGQANGHSAADSLN